MTTCVRLRSSTTTSSWVSPAFRFLAERAISVLPSALLDGLLGAHADAARRHHQFPVLVAVLGDGFGEVELPAAATLALPRLARLGRGDEDVAGADLAVVLVVLLGVETGAAAAPTAPASTTAGGAARLLARPEPRLARLGPEAVVGVELRAGLHEGGRRDHVPHFRLRRVLVVVVDTVGVAH